jgi:hypothetical protein
MTNRMLSVSCMSGKDQAAHTATPTLISKCATGRPHFIRLLLQDLPLP